MSNKTKQTLYPSTRTTHQIIFLCTTVCSHMDVAMHNFRSLIYITSTFVQLSDIQRIPHITHSYISMRNACCMQLVVCLLCASNRLTAYDTHQNIMNFHPLFIFINCPFFLLLFLAYLVRVSICPHFSCVRRVYVYCIPQLDIPDKIVCVSSIVGLCRFTKYMCFACI